MSHLDPKALEAARNAIVDVWDDARGIDPNLHTMAEKAIAAYIDALSSLPAQAVNVTVPQRWRDVGYLMACIDDAIEQGYDPDVDGPLLDEIRAELKAAPSQPAAVGEAEIEAAARAINPVAFQVDPPHAKDSDAKRMMRAIARNQAQDALTAAALVHRDQVKL